LRSLHNDEVVTIKVHFLTNIRFKNSPLKICVSQNSIDTLYSNDIKNGYNSKNSSEYLGVNCNDIATNYFDISSDSKKGWNCIEIKYKATGGENTFIIGVDSVFFTKVKSKQKVGYISIDAIEVIANSSLAELKDFRFDSSRYRHSYTDVNSILDPVQITTTSKATCKDTSHVFVYFDLASSSLDKNAISKLQGIAEEMKLNLNLRIILQGHTDDNGTDKGNNSLSKQRINKVQTYLISQGVSIDRIETISWGASKPIFNQMSKNRCVHIMFF
jgi:outer membrane protein OmpA-like peptidoglycan-associated protein